MNTIRAAVKAIKKIYERMAVRNMGLETERDARIRYFLIICPGHSGSLWFSKVLNSHPDVLCFHEGVVQRNFPFRYFHLDADDVLVWAYALKNSSASHYGKAYRAIGDARIPVFTPALLEILKEHFAIFTLVRNPILYVHSQMHSFDTEARTGLQQRIKKELEAAARTIPRIRTTNIRSPRARLFAYSCWTWRVFSSPEAARGVYRLEDLTKDAAHLAQAIKEVTNIHAAQDKWFTPLLRQMMSDIINTHVHKGTRDAQEIFTHAWTDTERELFKTICGKRARALYPELALYD